MPTSHPRVNVVLEKPLYRCLARLAKRDRVSLSLKARDLIREAIELVEDAYWEKRASERAQSFDPSKALSHHQVWKG